jgi:small conductance mechanosensitive channel
LPAPAADAAAASPDSQEALKNLITVLKDDTARQELIDKLEAEIAAPETPPDAAANLPGDALTFGGRVGEMTQKSAEAISHSLQQFWRQLLSFPTLLTSFTTSDYGAIGRVLASLLLLVIGTYGTFLLARLATQRFRDRLRLRGAREGWLAASVAVIVLLATNLALVVFAWAIGYVLALVLIGEAGELAFYHTLFLNAFLVTEGVQAVIRALLAPRRAELRLLPVSDEIAFMLTRWCRIAISVLAFGILLIVPLLTRNIGLPVGRAGAALVYVLVLVLVLNLILRIREPVTRRLKKATGNSNSQVLRILARSWHVPVMLYVIVLIGVALTQPEAVLLGLLLATAKVLVAIIIGMIVANLLTRLILSGVKLPLNVSQRVPLLERRLNAFVPRLLSILRFVVVIAVVGFALDTLGLFDVSGWHPMPAFPSPRRR